MVHFTDCLLLKDWGHKNTEIAPFERVQLKVINVNIILVGYINVKLVTRTTDGLMEIVWDLSRIVGSSRSLAKERQRNSFVMT